MEAQARIKINNLLAEAGWRLLDSEAGTANVLLESKVKITTAMIDQWGQNFEQSRKGFVDFLLVDDRGFPLAVLEAKGEDKDPLVGKEQAREYAQSLKVQLIILSNGQSHYWWDLRQGNPQPLANFPTPDSIEGYHSWQPNPNKLVNEPIEADYVVLTQKENYARDPSWLDLQKRPHFIELNQLKFLRPYQLAGIKTIQETVNVGQQRFLFEMATGTGKTLLAAAIIKLFLRTGNARRVLFLVDRLELENQAERSFKETLSHTWQTVIYKEERKNWRNADIVVTTIQSLLTHNNYQRYFSPIDFDLVISDEAHRSIGGNSRAVFEYFMGYKLGLTATPKDYLRQVSPSVGETWGIDPREYERRVLLDTYRTFGCESGRPTFRYSLQDGVKDGYLISPCAVDNRTVITTQLLSEKGFAVLTRDEEGNLQEQTFEGSQFEKGFFSEQTNRTFCQTFMTNALPDPISREMGKSIIFCVSQHHARKITQILNEYADQRYPGKYHSDFAMQVTSEIDLRQQLASSFSNNNLGGESNFLEGYRTSKSRVCVTVDMMTTGYDCPDLLNIGLMRPIFSPTNFVQIKGRGTRKHTFKFERRNSEGDSELLEVEKDRFKLFDFFAICEYFEEKFNYDQVLPLPKEYTPAFSFEPIKRPPLVLYENFDLDPSVSLREIPIGAEGMKVDRKLFKSKQAAFDEEFTKFVTLHQPESALLPPLKNVMVAYLTNSQIRHIINTKT